MAILWLQDGNPWAFYDGQLVFVHRSPPSEWEHLRALLTFEPLRRVYHPESSMYWNTGGIYSSGVVSVRFATPIVWLATAGMIAEGIRRRWLNRYEVVLALGPQRRDPGAPLQTTVVALTVYDYIAKMY